MSCVQGDLGEEIQNLMDESNEKWNEGKYQDAVDLLIRAWEKLPDNKTDFNESFLIIWGILDIAILIKDIKLMNQWVDYIFTADPGRKDTGERDMWAGRVAYESGNMEKALMYFKNAHYKSGGRSFLSGDKKYKEFLLSNEK